MNQSTQRRRSAIPEDRHHPDRPSVGVKAKGHVSPITFCQGTDLRGGLPNGTVELLHRLPLLERDRVNLQFHLLRGRSGITSRSTSEESWAGLPTLGLVAYRNSRNWSRVRPACLRIAKSVPCLSSRRWKGTLKTPGRFAGEPYPVHPSRQPSGPPLGERDGEARAGSSCGSRWNGQGKILGVPGPE